MRLLTHYLTEKAPSQTRLPQPPLLPEGRVTEEALLPPVTRGAGKRFGTYLLDPPTTIKSSTISGNTASPNGGGTGGGIYNWDGLTVIAFSTVANNCAANGKGSGIASYG